MIHRQKIIDAVIAELRHQPDCDVIDATGSLAEVRGVLRIARLAEAVIQAALDATNEQLIEEIARNLGPIGADWKARALEAGDAITGARGHLLTVMDPLP